MVLSRRESDSAVQGKGDGGRLWRSYTFMEKGLLRQSDNRRKQQLRYIVKQDLCICISNSWGLYDSGICAKLSAFVGYSWFLMRAEEDCFDEPFFCSYFAKTTTEGYITPSRTTHPRIPQSPWLGGVYRPNAQHRNPLPIPVATDARERHAKFPQKARVVHKWSKC